jgi:6,7-dimethyl-8-ribityllumazine synthase
MAGHAPEIGIKPLPNAKVAIISSSWHLDICDDLIAGAQRALTAAQVSKVEVHFVPGSFEIPLAAQYAFEAGFDAVVAVGLVLKEKHHTLIMCAKVLPKVLLMFR